MSKIKKCYVCKKCGQTHYLSSKPNKCSNCGRKLNKTETPVLLVEC